MKYGQIEELRYNNSRRVSDFLQNVAAFLAGRADLNRLRQMVTEYADCFQTLLNTETLEKLSQHTPRQEAYKSLRTLIDRILLRRYLLNARYDDFLSLAAEVGIQVPKHLERILLERAQTYQSHIKLITTLLELESKHPLLRDLRKDFKNRFTTHQPFVNVEVICEGEGFDDYQSLIRPAITFMIGSDESAKVLAMNDIFISAQDIDHRFRQTVEEIQAAMQLNQNGMRYWYQLNLLQNMVRNSEIRLSEQSVGAAIGWLIYLIENRISVHPNIVSVWGTYDVESRCFSSVDGLSEKLHACKEEGVRIVALPEISLREPTHAGKFREYAQQQKMHLIPFPDDLPLFEVYPFILERCQAFDVITSNSDTRDSFSRLKGRQNGELLRDNSKDIYWVQFQRKFYVPNFDIINHMKQHKMAGWEIWRDVPSIPKPLGPLFYRKNSQSNGLLIKPPDKPEVFLINDARRNQFDDEYSFENYVYQGKFLEWSDIITVTDEIVNNEFPTGERIHVKSALEVPADRVTLDVGPVTLRCKHHPNSTWQYYFQIARDSDFSSVVYENVTLSRTQLINDLRSGKYFWRVRGVKPGREPSAWSETWSFKIEVSS